LTRPCGKPAGRLMCTEEPQGIAWMPSRPTKDRGKGRPKHKKLTGNLRRGPFWTLLTGKQESLPSRLKNREGLFSALESKWSLLVWFKWVASPFTFPYLALRTLTATKLSFSKQNAEHFHLILISL
jgi:hypothetical protein